MNHIYIILIKVKGIPTDENGKLIPTWLILNVESSKLPFYFENFLLTSTLGTSDGQTSIIIFQVYAMIFYERRMVEAPRPYDIAIYTLFQLDTRSHFMYMCVEHIANANKILHCLFITIN